MKSTIRNLFCAAVVLALCSQLIASAKDVVYLTPGMDLPFWRYLSKGVESVAKKEGYGYQAFDSHNDAQTQLKNAQDAIARGVAGIVISPTDSSTCPSVLALAQKANIPVVIADIGTNEGEYVSFIISDNREGAYGTGKALGHDLLNQEQWEAANGWLPRSVRRRRTEGIRTRADAELYGQRNLQICPGHAYGKPKHEGNIHRDRSANDGCAARDQGGP
jgi:ribose transport system substrate-binding protein